MNVPSPKEVAKAGLEGESTAEKLLGQATGRARPNRAAWCAARCEEPGASRMGCAARDVFDPEPSLDPDNRGRCGHGAWIRLRRGYREARRSELSRAHGIDRLRRRGPVSNAEHRASRRGARVTIRPPARPIE